MRIVARAFEGRDGHIAEVPSVLVVRLEDDELNCSIGKLVA